SNYFPSSIIMIGPTTSAVVLSRQLWRFPLHMRTVYADPPKVPLKPWESIFAFSVLSAGCLAIPTWILTHMEDYKSREE
ncbi:hypothetical protein, partial [Salmonella sp. s54395]|uniref:hypothetical protein n=1 Tax=Salmonella sp. s54395 TaxID=3159664 RepID=UPI0039807790